MALRGRLYSNSEPSILFLLWVLSDSQFCFEAQSTDKPYATGLADAQYQATNSQDGFKQQQNNNIDPAGKVCIDRLSDCNPFKHRRVIIIFLNNDQWYCCVYAYTLHNILIDNFQLYSIALSHPINMGKGHYQGQNNRVSLQATIFLSVLSNG